MKKGNPQGRINMLRNYKPAPFGNKRALGNNGGRPSKWKDEFVEELIKYFSVEATKKSLVSSSVEYNKDGTERKRSDKYIDVPNDMPSIVYFARHIGVDYTTVHRWLTEGIWDKDDGGDAPDSEKTPDKFTEFRKAYQEALELRKQYLIKLGMSGISPSGAYIFTAKNLTDMRDEQTVNHNLEGIDELYSRLHQPDGKTK